MARAQKVPYMEAPELHTIIPARKPYVTDVMCNWEIKLPINKNVCAIILGSIVGAIEIELFRNPCKSVSVTKKRV